MFISLITDIDRWFVTYHRMMVLPSIIAFTLVVLADTSLAEEVLQSLDGVVGGENYTYYRLSRQGHLRIVMESLEGDADLYVSDKTGSPDFEDFMQQSVTCGLDVIDIPAAYSRPVGIGVYGYPIYETSKYRLTIILVSETDDESYDQLMAKYYNYERSAARASDPNYREPGQESVTKVSGSDEDEDEEGSVLWQILITLLKVFFEIVL